MNRKKYSAETSAIHSGRNFCGGTGAVNAPVYLSSTFASGNEHGFDYTQSGNPNFRNLEETLRKLEQADFATAFSSGVAAITAVASTLSAGNLILAEENLYGCTYRLFEQVFAKFGLRTKYLDFTDATNFQIIEKEKPALVWLESPTNPLLKIIDIKSVATACKNCDASLVVDNTFASSFLQQPLQLGATLSLSSTTKYINGHSDCLGGVVCTNSQEWNEKLLFSQKALGLNPSPFDSWLSSRGVKTLALRMKQHSENAVTLASFLQEQPNLQVYYPYLESNPQYELARQQMSAGSGIVSVDFKISAKDVQELLSKLELFTLAESLGGVESLVCHPATMTHASVPKSVREKVGISDSLVRFSVGIEAKEDLIKDLMRALG